MKNTLTAITFSRALFPVLCICLVACSGNREQTNEQEQTGDEEVEWPAMDNFHMLMAESFHPFMDSANLEPAKLHAAAMAESASQWVQSPLPKQVDNAEVRDKLRILSETTRSFVETVNTGDDEMIAGELEAIHDVFHEIQETWYAHAAAGHEDH